jgi:hypothetical protein
MFGSESDSLLLNESFHNFSVVLLAKKNGAIAGNATLEFRGSGIKVSIGAVDTIYTNGGRRKSVILPIQRFPGN